MELDLSIFNKITIVIITNNRYQFLIRLLKFYDSYNVTFNILVLDSSSDEVDNEELKEILCQENIKWKKYDPETFFVDKIAQGCEFINTEFAVLCPDDDFIIPSALGECIKFLIDNPDYSNAHGHYFSHTNYEKAKDKGFLIYPLSNKVHSTTDETGSERINTYLSGKTYYYPFYSVHRSNTFYLIWTESSKYVSDWGLSELFPCCMSFVYGKMKILPVFYASREPNYYNWCSDERRKKMYSEDKLQNAISGIGKHLSKVDVISIEEAESVARGAFDKYLNRVEEKFRKSSSRKNQGAMHLWKRFKQKARIRTRLRLLLMQGCHPSIYPEYLEDYKKVRKSVISAGLTSEELNKSRKDFAKQGKA